MTFLRLGLAVAIMCSLIDTNARAQSVPYGTGDWNADSLGNHRAVIRVHAPAGAVSIRVPWRRRDASPEDKQVIVQDAATDGRVANVLRVDINREFGDVIFEPISGPGEYYVYYMPYVLSGSANYPTTEYLPPEATAEGRCPRELLSRRGAFYAMNSREGHADRRPSGSSTVS